jgi:hypothetical protein
MNDSLIAEGRKLVLQLEQVQDESYGYQEHLRVQRHEVMSVSEKMNVLNKEVSYEKLVCKKQHGQSDAGK